MFGLRMSARSHETLVDHDGGDAEAVTEDHCGSPERLHLLLAYHNRASQLRISCFRA